MSEQQEGYFVQERYVSHPRQPWEYLQEEIPQAQWQGRLTELGTEGWELVQQYPSPYQDYVQVDKKSFTYMARDAWLCFFKRPKVTT